MQTKEIYNTLLISPGELKEESLINNNVEDKILGTIVITSQEIYLCKIIGTALLRKLQTLVYNAELGKWVNDTFEVDCSDPGDFE